MALHIPSLAKSRFEKLELFSRILFLIENQYYRAVDVEKIIQGAINGMMGTLDPHSAFLDKKVFSKMKEDTSGEFGGLGLEVTQKNGIVIVTTTIDDTPAFRAKIMAGDKIMEVDGDSTVGFTLDEVVQKMRGVPGTEVSIAIKREGNEKVLRFKIKREIIKVLSVKYQVIKKHYAYLRLTQFQKGTTQQFIKAIKKLRKQSSPLKGLVLDLRYNPGGLLNEAIDLSSIFLKEGVIVSIEGRNANVKEVHRVQKIDHKELEIPMIVLVNGASASASEIVAGALQDSKRAIIMGVRTFGKGSVQSVIKIDENRGVKLTIAQYMTPLGRKIQAFGIQPDIIMGTYEGDWTEKDPGDDQFLRESDLRNHLTAAIETEDEKQLRLLREKRDRQKRRVKAKETDTKKSAWRYNPLTDFQVNQAIKYLKTFELVKKIKAP